MKDNTYRQYVQQYVQTVPLMPCRIHRMNRLWF